jgi:hypothetical protein
MERNTRVVRHMLVINVMEITVVLKALVKLIVPTSKQKQLEPIEKETRQNFFFRPKQERREIS